MSPEAWMLTFGIVSLAASAIVMVLTTREIAKANAALKGADAAMEKAGERIKALTAERDAALSAKSAQFEEWQHAVAVLHDDRTKREAELHDEMEENAKLRADVAALEERLALTAADAARTESGLTKSLDDEQADAEKLREIILRQDAELALLRPIADSAERFMDGNHLPGEWADVRAAIRARKEAGNG